MRNLPEDLGRASLSSARCRGRLRYGVTARRVNACTNQEECRGYPDPNGAKAGIVAGVIAPRWQQRKSVREPVFEKPLAGQRAWGGRNVQSRI
jgi:hypothetical protein